MTLAFLGLGANLANPIEQVLSAIRQLSVHPQMLFRQASRLYVSRPMGPSDQPDYINAVVAIETDLSAFELLATCQDIEQAHERKRLRHWGERTLDIDLLCYGTLLLNTPQLTLPHLGITQRDFVLRPWADIDPDYRIPSLGRVGDLLQACPSFGATPLDDQPNRFQRI